MKICIDVQLSNHIALIEANQTENVWDNQIAFDEQSKQNHEEQKT